MENKFILTTYDKLVDLSELKIRSEFTLEDFNNNQAMYDFYLRLRKAFQDYDKRLEQEQSSDTEKK